MKKKLALVLSGGGARGAYEAGILHYIRTMLPKKMRDRNFDIHCGSSVGAINTCFLAATAHDHEFQGAKIRTLWENLREENIYRRDKMALLQFMTRSSRGILANLVKGSGRSGTHFHGLLDTAPFRAFLDSLMPWKMISKNIRNKLIQAVSIVATNVLTGKMELFVEKDPDLEYTGEYIVRSTSIGPIHAMASAAIPIVFPTIVVNDIPYTDGGLRLNTPMSPGIQLGADSILVIGLHHTKQSNSTFVPEPTGQPAAIGQVLGRVMNSIFLDRVQYDIEQLQRINRIIDWSEMLYGEKYIEDLNTMLRKRRIRGDVANRGLKRLEVLRINPSADIGEVFSHCYRHDKERHFGPLEKFLVRFLDIDPSKGNDFLSYLSFMPEYIKALIDLGFEDARQHHHELKAFLDQ